jgi:hypothetical protein
MTHVPEKRAAPSRYRALALSPAYEADKNRPEHPTTTEGKLLHEAHEKRDPSKLDEFQRSLYDKVEALVAKLATGTQFREMRFPILGADYGYGDLVALNGNEATYIDYKYGNNKQEPTESNPAAQAYALGIMTIFPYVTRVRVYYLYPRLDKVDHCAYYRSDLDKIVASISWIKARHDRATPETCAYHPDTCGWCKHLATCPTAAKKLAPVVNAYAEGHELPVLPDLSTLADPQKWAALLRVKPVLAQMAESIGRHALAQEFIPGYEKVWTNGRRTVTLPKEFVRRLREAGVPDEDLFDCVEVSIPEALKAYRKTLPRGKKESGEEEFLATLSDDCVIGSTNGYYKLRKTNE